MIEQAVRARLADDVELLHHTRFTTDDPLINELIRLEGERGAETDILSYTGVRVYGAAKMPYGWTPAILIRRTASERPGQLGAASGIVGARVRVECWVHIHNYGTGKRMSRRVRELLHGRAWTAVGLTVKACYAGQGERDRAFKKPGSKAPDINIVESDYEVWYEEATT